MATYNLNHPSTAYHCGGLLAVYARIQQLAMPNINAGIVQRYYASMSQTPALVLGQISRQSTFHLAKLENPQNLENHLEDLYNALQYQIPVTLTLEQQSYFALGYYQKWAELNQSGKMTEKKDTEALPAEEKEE